MPPPSLEQQLWLPHEDQPPPALPLTAASAAMLAVCRPVRWISAGTCQQRLAGLGFSLVLAGALARLARLRRVGTRRLVGLALPLRTRVLVRGLALQEGVEGLL